MVKPEWGIKRVCQNCGARFYDLNKSPIVCPKCETDYDPEAVLKSRRGRPALVEPKKKVKPEVVEAEEDDIEEDDGALAPIDDDDDDDDLEEVGVKPVKPSAGEDEDEVVDTDLETDLDKDIDDELDDADGDEDGDDVDLDDDLEDDGESDDKR
ncbi:MAG: FYDLN acid domain-containing protein [Alphaproteobacteria bacterium]|nr:FYDLN acid domain-containing protein [Alphaproteobacteria bacterium]